MLITLGFIWGVVSCFFRVMREDEHTQGGRSNNYSAYDNSCFPFWLARKLICIY